MTMQLDSFSLTFEPGERISEDLLAYVRSHNRHNAYELLMEAFERSGITRAQLARSLGKRPEVITRWLSAPSNLQMDSYSDLIFAISQHGIQYEADALTPPDESAYKGPDWLYDEEQQVRREETPDAPEQVRPHSRSVLSELRPVMQEGGQTPLRQPSDLFGGNVTHLSRATNLKVVMEQQGRSA